MATKTITQTGVDIYWDGALVRKTYIEYKPVRKYTEAVPWSEIKLQHTKVRKYTGAVPRPGLKLENTYTYTYY